MIFAAVLSYYLIIYVSLLLKLSCCWANIAGNYYVVIKSYVYFAPRNHWCKDKWEMTYDIYLNKINKGPSNDRMKSIPPIRSWHWNHQIISGPRLVWGVLFVLQSFVDATISFWVTGRHRFHRYRAPTTIKYWDMHLLYLNVYNMKFIIWANSTDFLKEYTDFFGLVQCIGCGIKIMLGLAVWRAGKRRDYLSY